jgi:hypothetical protein
MTKWSARRSDAAEGLGRLHWRKIRRIVGLTPWGAQLLFRVKHHALSVYDPISAGLNCPHATCGSAGRVDLMHVFWDCSAALQLRTLLLSRWAAAGLRLVTPERDFFSLSLDVVPPGILSATGTRIADYCDGRIGELGDTVERITLQCWSLDVDLYFRCVWRWRVAHFDDHNDISREHHEEVFAARMRTGHASIVQVNSSGPAGKEIARAGRVISAILGGKWTPTLDAPAWEAHAILVFHAGRTCAGSETGVSGTLIVLVQQVTGAF